MMGEQAQNKLRMIGGIYRVGQVMTAGPVLTTYTAYNRITNEVVGLLVLELPSDVNVDVTEQLLSPLSRRRSVKSTHVLQVYDWGIDGSRAYITTDPLRGITLRHVLDNENIDVPRALDFAQQIARGLCVLQEQGVTGVDLRPHLITVDSEGVADRVQIDDVGLRSLLKELGYVSSMSYDDIGFLDPRYVPPESIQGGAIGPWSDVYQLGLVLFELVTGRVPFVGRNFTETGVLQSTAPVPRMTQYKHNIPPALQDVIDRALAKNPVQRFPSAVAMLAALEALQIPHPHPAGQPQEGGSITAPQGKVQSAKSGATNDIPSIVGEATVPATPFDVFVSSQQAPGRPIPAIPVKDSAYAYLCFEQDGTETQRFAIKEKNVVVGRADPKRGYQPDVDLSTFDPKMTVSRQHARIRYEETFFYVEDLKSRNKTRLGELTLTPLKPELLRHGDILQCGAVRLVFKVPGT